jgi:hypothetical protein
MNSARKKLLGGLHARRAFKTRFKPQAGLFSSFRPHLSGVSILEHFLLGSNVKPIAEHKDIGVKNTARAFELAPNKSRCI